MPIYRIQCSVWHDSTLPRDAMTINPHFNDKGVTSNPQSLADDMATKLDTIVTGHPQVEAKVYDVNDPKPNPPKARKMLNAGSAPASSVCRELALCLSYYGGDGTARKRGRLFIPLQWLAITAIGVRPTPGQRAQVTDLRTQFSTLGGADVDWGVWSDTANAFTQAQQVYCDDEWDIVRSRGLRMTTRNLFATTG